MFLSSLMLPGNVYFLSAAKVGWDKVLSLPNVFNICFASKTISLLDIDLIFESLYTEICSKCKKKFNSVKDIQKVVNSLNLPLQNLKLLPNKISLQILNSYIQQYQWLFLIGISIQYKKHDKNDWVEFKEEFISDKNVESEEIFERSAINSDVLNDPNQPISLSAFLNAIDISAQITEIKNFGLWFGNQYPPESLGLLGYIGLSSDTLGEALLNMSRYFPEFQSHSTVKVSHIQNKIILEYGLLDGSIVSRRHDAELTLGTFLNVMRRALGSYWAPLEVHFNHGRPDFWQEHEKAFQTEVRFEQRRNAIIFNASDWSLPALIFAISNKAIDLFSAN